ncbi:MAG TPA: hypothetical protein VK105_07700 [Virgibacillus sp.]|nr:hypothetical protein [Virgibacillus sp.]HLR67007.1 hypothetical protein [Virgibacillus sp.]
MDFKKYKKSFDREYKNQQLLNLDIFNSLNTFNSDNSSKITYSLNKDLFYSSKKAIESLNIKEKYQWKVYKNNFKMLYLSYKTLNNQFNLSPEESFIDINASATYYIDVDIDSTKGLDITPIVIHYSNEQKTKLTKIVNRNQLLRFHENEDKCRLTFKVKGSGHFSIEHIKLLILR